MNFTISREDFLHPLQLVAGAVERRHTLPILGNILIRVNDNALWMTGTDLEVELITNVALVGNATNGTITVPAKKLLDIVRGLPDDCTILFSLEDNKALIKSGRARYSLSTLSADDYPNLEDWEGDSEFEISQHNLKQLIESVQFSMAQQDVRYYLNGMSLETSEHLIRSVATDGHRLAMSVVEYTDEVLPTKQVIIPRKGVMEISRLIDDSQTKVKVRLGANHISMLSNSFVFTSKLVDGRFPDYNRVVPKETNKGLIVYRDIIKGALSRAMILTNEKFKGVRLSLSAGELKITADNPEQEHAEEIIDVEYQGDDLEIGFNVAYLIDVLNAVDTDMVIFKLFDSNTMVLIHGVKLVDGLSIDEDSSQYVIMPMRI
jgi:DNA polymerase-3 subunit beta